MKAIQINKVPVYKNCNYGTANMLKKYVAIKYFQNRKKMILDFTLSLIPQKINI